MHGFLLTVFLNHSVAVAAVLAVIRCKTMHKNFQPFFLFIWLGCINETISLVMIYTKGYNTVNSNIYVLLECMLILYQFYTWQTIAAVPYGTLLLVACFVWVGDNLVWHRLQGNNSVFRIVYACMIIFCSLKQVHGLVAHERLPLIKNPVFLICAAFLMFYSCKAFVEVFNAFHLQVSHACTRSIFTILYVDDFVSNIIYAIAILCIPRKQLFTMPY